MLSACATTPLPKNATARVAIFPPATALPRARRKDVNALYELTARLLDGTSRLKAVPLKEVRRGLATQRRRAWRRCHSLRCQRKLGPRLFSATHGLSLKISRRGRRRCAVAVRLQSFAHRKSKIKARKLAACTGVALAGAMAENVCEILSKLHASARAECLVKGELFWLDYQAKELLAGRLNLERGKVAERILGLKGGYLEIAQRAGPRLGIVARCRAAWLYDQLAHHMTPKGQTPTGDAAGFRARAVILYRECVAYAEKTGIEPPAAARRRIEKIGGE